MLACQTSLMGYRNALPTAAVATLALLGVLALGAPARAGTLYLGL